LILNILLGCWTPVFIQSCCCFLLTLSSNKLAKINRIQPSCDFTL
jgi:hypothetical protein